MPFSFRCHDYINSVPLYWRTGDLDTQLFEIGLDEHSGAVCKATLTGFGSSIVEEEEEKYITIAGIPVCEVSLWSGDMLDQPLDYERRFRDEKKIYQVCVGRSYVRLDLDPHLKVKRWIAAGRMEFGLDNLDQIVSFKFSNLTVEEMKIIVYHCSPY